MIERQLIGRAVSGRPTGMATPLATTSGRSLPARASANVWTAPRSARFRHAVGGHLPLTSQSPHPWRLTMRTNHERTNQEHHFWGELACIG